MFSIIIPTFNNLEYLKLCLKSIEKNSKFKHEVIVYINEGKDGTRDYLSKKNYKTIFSENNKGVCVAFNQGVNLASYKYLVLAHDDMYFCPGWDQVFQNELENISEDKDFFMSGTMVQPFSSYLEFDCGKTYEDFNEKKLLNGVNKFRFDNFQGTHWQPSLIPKSTWNKVDGFSEEFSPGLGSDPDFNMKLWKLGVRLFKGLGKCRVYHFSSVSLRKKTWNNGSKTFLLKWGISIKFFKKYYLKSDTPFNGPLTEPVKNFMYYFELAKCKLAYVFHSILSKKNA